MSPPPLLSSHTLPRSPHVLQHTSSIIEVCLNLVLEFRTQSTSEAAAAYIGSPTAVSGGHIGAPPAAVAAAAAAAAAAAGASAIANHAARQRALFVADPVFQRDAHRVAVESIEQCRRINGEAAFTSLMATVEPRTLQQLRQPPEAARPTRSFAR